MNDTTPAARAIVLSLRPELSRRERRLAFAKRFYEAPLRLMAKMQKFSV